MVVYEYSKMCHFILQHEFRISAVHTYYYFGTVVGIWKLEKKCTVVQDHHPGMDGGGRFCYLPFLILSFLVITLANEFAFSKKKIASAKEFLSKIKFSF